jgi:phosphatidate cytidylyltransferase
MLRWRLLSAGVILGLLATLAILDFQEMAGMPPGTWLLPFLLLIAALGTEETLSLFAAKNLRPVQWPVYLGALAVTLAFGLPIVSSLWPAIEPNIRTVNAHAPLIVLALSVAIVMVAEMWRFRGPGQHIVHIALAVFTIVYIGVLGGFMAALRLHGNDSRVGMTALVSMVFVVKTSDVGAYAFGRLLGATKMTPRLSPGKTVEGAIGGIATACTASWSFFQFVAPVFMGESESWQRPTWLATMLYGLILAIAGMIGDLAESLLKRDMERKDSSSWLPGLGGVLDVIDSILVAGPAAYLCWELGLV